jgi:hypothetical protein
MRTELVKVTPEMAQVWLQMNSKNRPMRTRWVEELANTIKRGEFQLTHQGIAFDTDGVLLDGQHRLAAIFLADIAVEMMVTWGAPPETFQALDIGQKRSMSFITKNSIGVVSVARFLLMMADGDIHTRRAYTPVQISKAIEKIKLIDDPIMQLNTRFRRRHIASAQVTSAAITVARMNPEKSDKVVAAYEAAARQDFQNMPFSIQSLWSQLSDNVAKSRSDLTARAYVAFSRCFEDNTTQEKPKRGLIIVNPTKHIEYMYGYWGDILKECL